LRALVLTGACVVLFVAIYVVAFDTAAGLAFDRAAFGALLHRPRAFRLGYSLVVLLDVGSVVVVTLVLVAAAAVQRRLADGAAAFAVVTLSISTTELLKPVLGRLDPFGTDSLRAVPASFPSGHTTAATVLGVGLLLVAPHRHVLVAAFVGWAYSTAVGISLVAIASHSPSDVAAAFCVVGAWTGVVLAARDRLGPQVEARELPALPDLAIAGALALAAGLAVVGPLGFLLRGHVSVAGSRFVVAALGVAALAAVLFAAIALVAAPLRSRAARR
jgi:membrane-associated phospholipid phosphatase